MKNHSFVDGNKRIAAALFLWFLGLLKKAASGVLAIFPCSRTQRTLRA
ncbi:MAG: Fic family protein [Nitrospiraceae bacterium]|nr:Fic family protein [Nitrospiraceae bacterium]